MRLSKPWDATTLEVMALSYRVQRVLSREFSLNPLQSSILFILGSYAIQDKSGEVASLSVGEVQALLAYNKSNKIQLYYQMKRLCEGKSPHLKKELRGRTTYYSLTARGMQLIMDAVKLAKVYRFEVTQIAALTNAGNLRAA